MRRRQRSVPQIIEQVTIIDAGSEGMAIAKPEQKVVFVPFGAPGDIVDLKVVKRGKNFFEGEIFRFHSYSKQRVEPACSHFGICGGCKWQHLAYEHQLRYKQQIVKDNFDRIGKFSYPSILPILGSDQPYFYRNKLEYTFSPHRWLTEGKPSENISDDALKGLGFHLPKRFDRILDIEKCHLQHDLGNEIRLFVREQAIRHGYSFYHAKKQQGLLRNLILRNTHAGEWMLILVISTDDQQVRDQLLPQLIKRFPQLVSVFLVINPKLNTQISDLTHELVYGLPYLTETMPSPLIGQNDLHFRIGPKSFFQPNTKQAGKLYHTAFQWAALTAVETVYDLYCGIGTIANYLANMAAKVIGIEHIEEAVEAARENSRLNHIKNTEFIAGDMAEVFNWQLIERSGRPDIVITDPPRAGMHPKVISRLIELSPEKIIYISCNPATQARDIALLNEKYSVQEVQPVDMFPQTHHVENMALLSIR
ncbi:MAG: 23S rRNA (uracil(1939)-C(5))-methyltransferase RlmD [Bacteroidales bacterium]|nr:23S rRNA (uracil(1939)-C(5))-methyltransferase RlmD [Bacteroidales bacterium]